ncbi:MAG: von Willebrand factor type A domain-containing protein [Gemmatimonadota bacterium]
MRRILGVTPLFLILAATAFVAPDRETVTITGQVVDDSAGTPLAGVQVNVVGTRRGTLTDRAGAYALQVPRTAFANGIARLRMASLGYAPEEVEVALPDAPAGTVRVDVRLRRRRVDLESLVLSAEADASTTFAPRRAAALGFRHRPHPDWNREQYAYIEENVVRSPVQVPLSTFSIDVDRASYSNVRRFLEQGNLPPIDAVQIEEMINYFPYEYTLPGTDHPLALTTELGEAPWREGHHLLRIGLASPPIDTADLPPNNLVFLIDVSGSMMPADKLPLVKRALRLLVEELRPEDRVALVVYAGSTGLVLESTPGTEKERILDAIERLEAGGSTAGGAGLRHAYAVAEQNFIEGGNNRVILATDGDFNVGESSDAAMIRLIQELSERGTYLTVLGFGTGNVQFEKMQQLAQHGSGNHHYVDSLDEARKVLVEEMGGTLLTVASDVRLQVEFNPARVRAYRLIGYENRLLPDEAFDDDDTNAGELGAGHRVTALYEIVPVGADSNVEVGGEIPLRYREAGGLSEGAGDDELVFVRLRYRQPGEAESRLLEHAVESGVGTASEDFTFAAAVAGFGMLLRESEHRGEISSQQVLDLASRSLGADPHGYRGAFVEMVRRYRFLAEGEAVGG